MSHNLQPHDEEEDDVFFSEKQQQKRNYASASAPPMSLSPSQSPSQSRQSQSPSRPLQSHLKQLKQRAPTKQSNKSKQSKQSQQTHESDSSDSNSDSSSDSSDSNSESGSGSGSESDDSKRKNNKSKNSNSNKSKQGKINKASSKANQKAMEREGQIGELPSEDEEDFWGHGDVLYSPPPAIRPTVVGGNNSGSVVMSELLGKLQELKAAGDGRENGFSRKDVEDLLLELHALWTADIPAGSSPFEEGVSRFWPDDPMRQCSVQNVEEEFKKTLFQVLRIQFACTTLGIIEAPIVRGMPPKRRPGDKSPAAAPLAELPQEDLGGNSYSSRISAILKAASHFKDLMVSHLRLMVALDPSALGAEPVPLDPCRFTGFDPSQLNDRQAFIIFCLNELQAHGYRRYNGACYQQRVSEPIPVNEDDTGLPLLDATGAQVTRRYPTHSWEHAEDLDKFVRRVTSKEDRFAQWSNMTKPGNFKETLEYLLTCSDPEFPTLEPDRHWFAFKDGLLHTENGMFYKYGDKDIPPGIVACNYFDGCMLKMGTDGKIIIEQDHWYDVNTPAMQSIFEFQLSHLRWKDNQVHEDSDGTGDHPEKMHDVIFWFYVFFGRLLFEVNEKDSWQVILFIVGVAGTGKSTVLDALASFFRPEDVELLANKGRKGDGGLQTFLGKFLWMCREVKGDMTLDQADLQSMITGETMSITVLFKPSVTVQWKVPGILAGNEPAGWVDNSGSISRRIIMAFFEHRVDPSKSNPRLKEQIRTEMPEFLYKCCIAYLSAVAEFGDKDLWGTFTNADGERQSILPPFFHDGKKKLQAMTHPLENFLRSSDAIKTGPEAKDGMPWEAFKVLANAWMLDNNAGKGMKWDEDKFKTVFENYKIKKIALSRQREYDGKMYDARSQWLVGVTEARFLRDADSILHAASEQLNLGLSQDLDLGFGAEVEEGEGGVATSGSKGRGAGRGRGRPPGQGQGQQGQGQQGQGRRASTYESASSAKRLAGTKRGRGNEFEEDD